MRESPMATIIVFAFLGIAGVLMTVLAGNITTGFNQTILANLGSAIFAGALAYSLSRCLDGHANEKRNRRIEPTLQTYLFDSKHFMRIEESITQDREFL